MTHPAPLPDKAALLARARPARAGWDGARRPPRDPVPPGGESVWDYPRPPEIRPAPGPVRVRLAGAGVAASDRALRVVETAGAPVYYLPPEDVTPGALRPAAGVSVCEWKGAAVYYDVVAGGAVAAEAAFAYPDPFDDLADEPARDYARIAGWIGFYPAKVECYVGDERAAPQPGGLYAGWVTSNIAGPIKGGPGTGGW